MSPFQIISLCFGRHSSARFSKLSASIIWERYAISANRPTRVGKRKKCPHGPTWARAHRKITAIPFSSTLSLVVGLSARRQAHTDPGGTEQLVSEEARVGIGLGAEIEAPSWRGRIGKLHTSAPCLLPLSKVYNDPKTLQTSQSTVRADGLCGSFPLPDYIMSDQTLKRPRETKRRHNT